MTQLLASQGFGNYNMLSASQDNFEGNGNYANPNGTPTLSALKSNLKPGALVALSYEETFNNVNRLDCCDDIYVCLTAAILCLNSHLIFTPMSYFFFFIH